jgi:putative Ca2+/H+ antiporter (TMEM165/GDT1 family)
VRRLSALYAFIGWAIVALGALHMLATLRLSASTPIYRIWFFGSGLAMALVGALNLLNRVYGHSAGGVRIVCRIANILLTLLGLVAGLITGAGVMAYVFVISLLGGALLLSFIASSHTTVRRA